MSAGLEQRVAAPAPDAITYTRLRGFIGWITAGVVLFGTVLVFSASTVLSYKNHGNAYTYGLRHLLSVLGGAIFLLWAQRRKPSWWRGTAWVFLLVCLAMQMFALLHGAAIGGQRN